MTKAERDALRELLAKATPGPWTHDYDRLWASVVLHGFEIITSRMADRAKATADAAFIAAARNSIGALLDALDAAESENEQMTRRLEDFT